MNNVLSLILGGGRGTRLYPLTKLRSKPAVPVAGKYRLIDIPISNCLNSGLNRVYVLTQFLSASLNRHISYTYKFDPFSRGFVEILAATQTAEQQGWFQGTADAVRQQVRYVQEDRASDMLILSGDQLYRMDFRELIRTHRDNQADVTIAVLPVSSGQVAEFGIVQVDNSGRVTGFVEKPKTAAQLETLTTPARWLEQRDVACNGRQYLASMGIYLFRRDVLLELLNRPPFVKDFGKEVFPNSIHTHRVQAHLFDGYWEDLGTVKSYHEANLALAGDRPPFDFYSAEGVIYTRMRYLPASRIHSARLEQCLISDGCVIQEGTCIEHSVIGVRSQIGRHVTIRNSVVIGADEFETAADHTANRENHIPDMGVGDGTLIDRAIVDKDCRIGRNVQIVNRRELTNHEENNYVIRDGIVVIPKGSILPDNTVI